MARPSHSPEAFLDEISPQPHDEVILSAKSNPLETGTRFGYLSEYADADRLETNPITARDLSELGISMREQSIEESPIPSLYTYFGQFIAHDVTFDPITKNMPITKEMSLGKNIEPLNPKFVEKFQNRRTGLLDLDSVYGPGFDDDAGPFDVPRNKDNKNELKLGVAYDPIAPVRGTDLPRGKKPPFQALIGDSRNDENLPVSQLHLAFMRAHNKLVQTLSFDDAKSLLRRRYQHLVINDFLPRLVHADDLAEAQAKQGLYSPEQDFFIPIEFAAAAFRFGHSMIRSKYAFNRPRGTVPLLDLFTRNAMGGYFQILADWVIDWSNFGTNNARALMPQLVEPLAEIIDKKGMEFSLAVNDLLRGYLLGLPTGQGLAKALKVKATDVLSDAEVLASAISPKQKEVLEASGFHKRTPLWFYLFAEAQQRRGGTCLGPVCGQLVALVLKELARRSNHQDDDPWNNILGKKANFNLSEFLRNTLP